MSRMRNDGKGRIGGRCKGTPNKVTTDLKTWIADILDNGRGNFEKKLEKLPPMEYVRVFTSLLNYVLPKQQAESIKENTQEEYNNLIKLIDEAPDKFVDRITEKIINIKENRNGK